jgi:hypothetical protein
MPDIEVSYLHVHRNLDVARTVAVTPAINVDLDAFGRVYGVERIGGPVDTETLTAVLRELPQLNLCAKGCKLVAAADEAAAAEIESWIGRYSDPTATEAERDVAHGLRFAAHVVRTGRRP